MQAALEENEEHSRVLVEHLDSVRLEIRHTQGRLAARTKEVEGEAHLRQLAEREGGRLRADVARLAAQRGELVQRVTAMQTEAFQASERLDQFKLLQNWNQVGAGGWAVVGEQMRVIRLRTVLNCGGCSLGAAGDAVLKTCALLLVRGRTTACPPTNPHPTRRPQEELEQWSAAAKQKEEDSLALERYRRQVRLFPTVLEMPSPQKLVSPLLLCCCCPPLLLPTAFAATALMVLSAEPFTAAPRVPAPGRMRRG